MILPELIAVSGKAMRAVSVWGSLFEERRGENDEAVDYDFASILRSSFESLSRAHIHSIVIMKHRRKILP